MKNLRKLMLFASVVAMIFILPACSKKDQVIPPTEELPNDDDDNDQDDGDQNDDDDQDNDDQDDEPIVPASKFSEITRAHVAQMAEDMTASGIWASDDEGVYFVPGMVYVYTTNQGKLGKFEVKSVVTGENYKLTIHAVTFNEDGSIAKENTSLVIRGTWACDLDEMAETVDDEADFYWDRYTETKTLFQPANNTKFALYTFEDN